MLNRRSNSADPRISLDFGTPDSSDQYLSRKIFDHDLGKLDHDYDKGQLGPMASVIALDSWIAGEPSSRAIDSLTNWSKTLYGADPVVVPLALARSFAARST
jgi:hypothetical protein